MESVTFFKPVGWRMLWPLALWLGGSPLLSGVFLRHTGGSRKHVCSTFPVLTGCTLAGRKRQTALTFVLGHRD